MSEGEITAESVLNGDEKLARKGVAFNIQRFSVDDGPGIRTTVFLKGCPLICDWCSNPESQKLLPEIITRDIKCIKCEKCIEVCPQKAISVQNNARAIDWSKCSQCLKCAEVCPSGAIRIVGKYLSIEEVLEEVMRDAGFYRMSDGGMTLSGGEPLIQWQFARNLLQQAQNKGLHTAVDTTGYADWDTLKQVTRYADLVLFDIKHMDSDLHCKATGVYNEEILSNLEKLSTAKTRIWIRYPLIPGFNDSEEHLLHMARFVLHLGHSVEKVSLLPYHKFAEAKYKSLGRSYPCEKTPLPSSEKLAQVRDILESHGVLTTVGS